METIIPLIGPIILTIIGLFCLALIYPFLRSIWIRPMMLLWGFYLGARKRNYTENVIAASQKDNPRVDPKKNREIVQNIIHDEEDSIKQGHDEVKTHLDNRIKEVDFRIEKHKENFKRWRETTDKRFFSMKFTNVEEKLRNVKSKNIALLCIAIFIIYIDALIARHVFVSLGLFTNETLTIGGRDFPGGYPLLYGAFLTVALAGFLHFALKIQALQTFFFERQWGRIIVVGIMLSLFFLLLSAVLFPDAAKALIEIAVRVSWGLGVIIVYWSGSRIIGENEDYGELMLPVTLGLLILGWVIAGAGFVLELVVGRIFDIFANIILSANKVRLRKRCENEFVRYQAFRQGFRRGFSF